MIICFYIPKKGGLGLFDGKDGFFVLQKFYDVGVKKGFTIQNDDVVV